MPALRQWLFLRNSFVQQRHGLYRCFVGEAVPQALEQYFCCFELGEK